MAKEASVLELLLVAYTWQAVGVWRSATKNPQRGGSRFWAGIAKAMVVVGVLRLIGELATGVAPIYSRFVDILVVEEPKRQLSVSSSTGGTVLEFNGEIKVGAHKLFLEGLRATPNAKIVKLTSNGGWISEAQDIAREVQARGLKTVITDYCVSACSHIFLSGSERWIADEGRLGFHAPSNQITNQTDKDDIAKEKRALVDLGVPPALADKAMATPSTSMWYPTEIELERAKLISGVLDRSSFEESGLIVKVSVEDRLRAALAKHPVFEVIRVAEPAVFEKLVAGGSAAFARDGSVASAALSMRALYQPIVEKYLPLASDSALMQMVAISQQYLQRLRRDDVLACVALSDSSKAPNKRVDLSQYKDLSAKEIELQAEIIRTGSRTPARVPSAAEVMSDLQDVLTKIERNLPGKVALFDRASLLPSEYDAYCEVNIEFFRQISYRDRLSQVRLLRHIFSKV